MHTVIRTYSGKGAVETIDLIIASKKDIKKNYARCKGLYQLFGDQNRNGRLFCNHIKK